MTHLIDENTGIEMLYRKISLDVAEFEPTSDIRLFLDHCDLLDVPEIHLKGENTDVPTENWLIPDHYLEIDVTKYLIDRCTTAQEKERVHQELELFRAKNLENVLRLMIYIVDVMEENRIVWGVGRGSSVASYCLYLIGVHQIDSIQYDIPITEFLRG